MSLINAFLLHKHSASLIGHTELPFLDFTLKLVVALCTYSESLGALPSQQPQAAAPASEPKAPKQPVAEEVAEEAFGSHVLAYTRDLPQEDPAYNKQLYCISCKSRGRMYCKGCKQAGQGCIFYCYIESDTSDGTCFPKHLAQVILKKAVSTD